LGIGAQLFRFHRAVIADEARSLPLGAARAALRCASALYGAGVCARNCLYNVNLRKARSAPVPVISVGNITAGGTGKTPFVAWLARLMIIHKIRPAILSRGYGHHARLGIDDENELLARQLQEVPVVVDPNRVRGAHRAVAEHNAELLILDDGFQHRRIARDLDIVLIDAVWPFGAGHMLPRGLLREPLSELRRADFFVLTRAGLVGADRRQAIREQLVAHGRNTTVATCDYVIEGLRPVQAGASDVLGADALAEGSWAAFCGVGNPEGFRLTLDRAGCRLAFMSVFADHHRYNPEDVNQVIARAERSGCQGLLTTEKDAVKVERLLTGKSVLPIYSVSGAMEFSEGSTALIAAILKAAGRPA